MESEHVTNARKQALGKTIYMYMYMNNNKSSIKRAGLLIAATEDFCPLYIVLEYWNNTKKLQWQWVETVVLAGP